MNDTTITSYYEADHDRLDSLFKLYQKHKWNDVSSARETFAQYRSGLLRHIAWEEEILFPVFENRTGMASRGPTEVMRREHSLIKSYLDTIYSKLLANDVETGSHEEALLHTLFVHNQKEEQILYPSLDKMIADEERGEIFEAMKQMS